MFLIIAAETILAYCFYVCHLYVWKLVMAWIDCDVTIKRPILWRQMYGKRPTLPNGWNMKFWRGGTRSFIAGWTRWSRELLCQSDSLLLVILPMRYNKRFYVPLKNISLIWRFHHCLWWAANFRPLLGAQGLWAGRDIYRATAAVARDLRFSGLIRRTAPISCLLRHIWGCGGSILSGSSRGS
jgi:hypothetical protein